MSKTNSGLLAYAKAQVGLPYWYGTFGQTASASLYASKKAQYPDSYTASDFASQYGKRVHDCVGLIKGYLWSDTTTSTPTYNAAQDKSASGMYAAATTKGKISTFPKTAGLLVFKGTSKITHVGVYDGAGYVYEAKGHSYGVVKTKYAASDWQYWAQCPYCTDDTTSASTTSSSSSTTSSSTTATDAAKSFDKSIAGTYKTTANLNMRSGAGTDKTILVTMPKGQSVTCYGYYTSYNGTDWYYVVSTYGGVEYTGFCSSKYLSK